MMRIVDATFTTERLEIGRRGENLTTTVVFDITGWDEGEVRLMVRRPKEVYPYPVDVAREENTVSWVVTNTDTARDGLGGCELQLIIDDAVAKSKVFQTVVIPSLETAGEVPPAGADWANKAIKAAEDAGRAALDAQEAVAHMPIIQDGNWFVWDFEAEEYVDTGVVATEHGMSDEEKEQLFMNSLRLEKLAPYLYTAAFSDYDYAEGNEYFSKYKPASGGCSAVLKGSLLGRNFDWEYDERCTFVARTAALYGRHAVLGVACGTPSITQEVVDTNTYHEDFHIVPFLLRDGVNDAGLVCEINVVPLGDMGKTTGTNPEGEDLCATMIPRFVLDNAGSVDEAIELLESRNIFCVYGDGLEEELHFLLSDGTRTVEIEFISNEMVVVENFVDDKPIVTNFYLYGFDGTKESLTPYAAGVERYHILADGFDSVHTENDMAELMKRVWYTNAYSDAQNPVWYSEFVGDYTDTPFAVNLTKYSSEEDFYPVFSYAAAQYRNRTRDGATWQTVHSAVYNLEKKTLTVRVQEVDEPFSFRLTHADEADEPCVVMATFDANGGVYHCSCTYGDLTAFAQEGRVVLGAYGAYGTACMTAMTDTMLFPFERWSESGGETVYGGADILVVHSDDSVELWQYMPDPVVANDGVGEEQLTTLTVSGVKYFVMDRKETATETDEAVISLTAGNTSVAAGTPTSIDVTLPEPEEGMDTLCGVSFRAGADFTFSDSAPEGYTVFWEDEPVWIENAVYSVLYRCLWIPNSDGDVIIAALWHQLTEGVE